MGAVYDIWTGDIIENPKIQPTPQDVISTLAMLSQRKHQIASMLISWTEADGQIKCTAVCENKEDVMDMYWVLNNCAQLYYDVAIITDDDE